MPENLPREAAGSVTLRPTAIADLATLYEYHANPAAAVMAVMTPRNRQEFMNHWTRIIADPTVVARSILADGTLAGSISCFSLDGVHCVGYWIGSAYWGRGIATRALRILLDEVQVRPLHARVARTNIGSARVLERAGFSFIQYRHAPAEGQFPACEEALFELR